MAGCPTSPTGEPRALLGSKYGYYNWLRTWGGFDAPEIDASTTMPINVSHTSSSARGTRRVRTELTDDATSVP